MLNSPGFIAVDRQYNKYITDCANNVIRKVSYSTGIINTVVGNHNLAHLIHYPTYWGGYSRDGGLAINAELNCPAGIALDDSSNIYFTDKCNNVVRKVDNSSGIINNSCWQWVWSRQLLSGNYSRV